MESKGALSECVHYGRAVFESGISGLRSGEKSYLHGQSLSAVLAPPARNSLRIGVIGACLGLLALPREPRNKRLAKSIFYGAVGSAIGFCAGLAWNTRELTGSAARSALRQMGSTRDNLWLERHPIDYA
jgi:hypothetical protein